jgi:hypothetical protein
MDSYDGPSILMCYKSGDKMKNLNAVETHHITGIHVMMNSFLVELTSLSLWCF